MARGTAQMRGRSATPSVGGLRAFSSRDADEARLDLQAFVASQPKLSSQIPCLEPPTSSLACNQLSYQSGCPALNRPLKARAVPSAGRSNILFPNCSPDVRLSACGSLQNLPVSGPFLVSGRQRLNLRPMGASRVVSALHQWLTPQRPAPRDVRTPVHTPTQPTGLARPQKPRKPRISRAFAK